jgi:hypothetical protein
VAPSALAEQSPRGADRLIDKRREQKRVNASIKRPAESKAPKIINYTKINQKSLKQRSGAQFIDSRGRKREGSRAALKGKKEHESLIHLVRVSYNQRVHNGTENKISNASSYTSINAIHKRLESQEEAAEQSGEI